MRGWWLLFFVLHTGLAQPTGNFERNDLGRQAARPTGPLQAGCLWRVLPAHLNGRREPDPKAPVVRVFRRGTVLQADVGRGGSDEVLFNARDRQGNTWMRVRTAEGRDLNCYVRAHRDFIAPVFR